MATITLDGVRLENVKRHDNVIAVNGDPLDRPGVVLQIDRKGDAVTSVLITPTAAFTERRLYPDLHQEVRVEREIVTGGARGEVPLTPTDIVVIMDSLLVMAERLEASGDPSFQVRRALAKVKHYAAHPAAEVEGVLRLRRTPEQVEAMKIDDLPLTVATYNRMRRALVGIEAVTVGDLIRHLPAVVTHPRINVEHEAELRAVLADLGWKEPEN